MVLFCVSRVLAAVSMEVFSPVSSALAWLSSWPRRVCTYLPTVEAPRMASRDRTQTPGVVLVRVRPAAAVGAEAAGPAAGLAAAGAGLAAPAAGLAWAKATEQSASAAIAAAPASMRER